MIIYNMKTQAVRVMAEVDAPVPPTLTIAFEGTDFSYSLREIQRLSPSSGLMTMALGLGGQGGALTGEYPVHGLEINMGDGLGEVTWSDVLVMARKIAPGLGDFCAKEKAIFEENIGNYLLLTVAKSLGGWEK